MGKRQDAPPVRLIRRERSSQGYREASWNLSYLHGRKQVTIYPYHRQSLNMHASRTLSLERFTTQALRPLPLRHKNFTTAWLRTPNTLYSKVGDIVHSVKRYRL